MTRRQWLPTLVRARQAHEDAAAQRVAEARREVLEAGETARLKGARIATMRPDASVSLRSFLAAAAARDAAAATHSAAVQRLGFAQQRLQFGIGELSTTARARRAVERLAERIQAEEYAAYLASQQRELDDLSITRFGRAAGTDSPR